MTRTALVTGGNRGTGLEVGRQRMVAAEAGPTVLVNAADPGWVATRMGGAGAPTPVDQGADTVVRLATLPDDGPTDGFFHRRRRIAW